MKRIGNPVMCNNVEGSGCYDGKQKKPDLNTQHSHFNINTSATHRSKGRVGLPRVGKGGLGRCHSKAQNFS